MRRLFLLLEYLKKSAYDGAEEIAAGDMLKEFGQRVSGALQKVADAFDQWAVGALPEHSVQVDPFGESPALPAREHLSARVTPHVLMTGVGAIGPVPEATLTALTMPQMNLFRVDYQVDDRRGMLLMNQQRLNAFSEGMRRQVEERGMVYDLSLGGSELDSSSK